MNKDLLTRFTGCLIGGAVGDAMGAPVEFLTTSEIIRRYGKSGVDKYIEFSSGKGQFTDDTQMTLFTAEGILQTAEKENRKDVIKNVHQAYIRWLYTQSSSSEKKKLDLEYPKLFEGKLINDKRLYKLRAPGNTCLSALRSKIIGTIDKPINNSKGCGGIMRVAPVGLFYSSNPELAFTIGCDLAAITHGHPSGYLSAGFFACVLAFLLQSKTLSVSINETIEILFKWPEHNECLNAVKSAMKLAQTAEINHENIESLGGTWVGEEALAISLFCAIKNINNPVKAIVDSVNHSGDSDSTGAITGNIIGLIYGKNSFPKDWIDNLELNDIIEEMANDLYSKTTINQ